MKLIFLFSILLVPISALANSIGEYSCKTVQYIELKADGTRQIYRPVTFKINWIPAKSDYGERIWIQKNEQLMMSETIYDIEDLPKHENDQGAVSFRLYRPAKKNMRNNTPELNGGGIFKKGSLYLTYTSSLAFLKSTTVVIAQCKKL